MNSPILVWMLYLNREVTTEVSSATTRFFFSSLLYPSLLSLSPRTELNCPL